MATTKTEPKQVKKGTVQLPTRAENVVRSVRTAAIRARSAAAIAKSTDVQALPAASATTISATTISAAAPHGVAPAGTLHAQVGSALGERRA